MLHTRITKKATRFGQ